MRAVVILLGLGEFGGHRHCDSLLKYLQQHSPHLKEEGRVLRLYNEEGASCVSKIAQFMSDLHASGPAFDVLLWFHSAHGCESTFGGKSYHVLHLNNSAALVFADTLRSREPDISRISPTTVLGFLVRHRAMEGKCLLALAGSCRQPGYAYDMLVRMSDSELDFVEPVVKELFVQHGAQLNKRALLSDNDTTAAWSNRLVQTKLQPSENLMWWLHEASGMLKKARNQLVDTYRFGEFHLLNTMRLHDAPAQLAGAARTHAAAEPGAQLGAHLPPGAFGKRQRAAQEADGTRRARPSLASTDGAGASSR